MDKNNEKIYSAEEIERLLSRDTVFNAIKLFRVLLVEFSFTNKDANVNIPSPLLLLYSSWEFIEKSTQLQGEQKVALNNDSYTINEYLLQYLFNGYLSLFFLMRYTKGLRIKQTDENHDSSFWPLKQLFAKLDSLIGHENIVSSKSKHYYLEALLSLYFEMSEY